MELEDLANLPKWKKHSKSYDGAKVVCDASLSGNQFIYHYLPWPFAIGIFQRKSLRLSSIDSWQDPYEREWDNFLFSRPNCLLGVHAYGLCWTTARFDEPFWRMAGFRREKAIVRIRCRVNDILVAGEDLIRRESGSLYLGRVSYVRQKALDDLATNMLRKETKDVSSTACRLLLKKRRAFRFESEVRLLWLDRSEKKAEILVPINATEVINQVMITPHATSNDRAAIKDALLTFGVRPLKSGIFNAPVFI